MVRIIRAKVDTKIFVCFWFCDKITPDQHVIDEEPQNYLSNCQIKYIFGNTLRNISMNNIKYTAFAKGRLQ